MSTLLIKNAQIVNEGKVFAGEILIQNGRIQQIGTDLSNPHARILDVQGKYVIPGVIDDQVHFREPGLTHKATIYTEAKAAVAGGTTTFMEMPNTVPNALTQSLLAEKYAIAAQTSLANYSFFMGASNDNYDEAMKTNLREVCGLKIFMGSSTGNMLVDDQSTLARLFGNFPGLIATHCEDEATVRAQVAKFQAKYPKESELPADIHAQVRDVEACILSSRRAVELATKLGTRLHVLHISTQEELALFRNDIPLREKKVTAEVCIHHLWFDAQDYNQLGNLIKCNPSIKHGHREALWQGLLDDKLDILATDHAPHTWDEKNQSYWSAPSGLPLVQHSLLALLEKVKLGVISIEKMVEKAAHAPAICFEIEERGFIREGYWADLVVVDLEGTTTVTKENILAKCGWSPFEGHTFPAQIDTTIVSGHVVYHQGTFDESVKGQRIFFERN
ncbi:MAG: dihydroorotase [Spirosomataceae bacterium]